MGLIETFMPEDKVQMTFSQFHGLIKESTKFELLMNGVKNDIPHEYIRKIMGEKEGDEACQEE